MGAMKDFMVAVGISAQDRWCVCVCVCVYGMKSGLSLCFILFIFLLSEVVHLGNNLDTHVSYRARTEESCLTFHIGYPTRW